MAPRAEGSRLTWLDLLLIGAIAVAAFGVSGLVGGRLATTWFGAAKPRALFDMHARVFEHRDAAATVERRQVRLRDRMAQAAMAELAPTAAPRSGPTAAPVDPKVLAREAKAMVKHQEQARVALGNAELLAARRYAEAQRDRRLHEGVSRAAIAFPALLAIAAIVWLVGAIKHLPIAIAPVTAGAAILLTGLLLAGAAGLLAALALAVAILFLVLRARRQEA